MRKIFGFTLICILCTFILRLNRSISEGPKVEIEKSLKNPSLRKSFLKTSKILAAESLRSKTESSTIAVLGAQKSKNELFPERIDFRYLPPEIAGLFKQDQVKFQTEEVELIENYMQDLNHVDLKINFDERMELIRALQSLSPNERKRFQKFFIRQTEIDLDLPSKKQWESLVATSLREYSKLIVNPVDKENFWQGFETRLSNKGEVDEHLLLEFREQFFNID